MLGDDNESYDDGLARLGAVSENTHHDFASNPRVGPQADLAHAGVEAAGSVRETYATAFVSERPFSASAAGGGSSIAEP